MNVNCIHTVVRKCAILGNFEYLKNTSLYLLFVCERNDNKSQYKGVTWHRGKGKWQVQLQLKGQKPKHGRTFKDELDAAKKVNELCEEFGIPLQNPEITAIPNQPYQVIPPITCEACSFLGHLSEFWG